MSEAKQMLIKKRQDGQFMVWLHEQVIAGPFMSGDEAAKWITKQPGMGLYGTKAFPDEVIRVAKNLERDYIHRVAREDLATLIARAIIDERRRCYELTLAMNWRLIDKSEGLVSRPTFNDLAGAIHKGDTI